jgi:hypothetical protein
MSSPVFSRTDTTTDLETFYSSVVDLFDEPDEREEVKELLTWWNRCALIHLPFTRSLTSLQQSDISELLSCSTPHRKAQRIGEDKGKTCSAEEHD